jgi:hypothetical protein
MDVPIAIADAEGVAGILQDPDLCGYPASQIQVISNAGATKDGILSALDGLADRAKPDDTVFFFHCGHGTLGTDGAYYLVSHDSQIEGKRVKAGTGVSEPELLEKLRHIKARRLLMIFNACYSGHIAPSLDLAGREVLETSNPGEDTTSALLGTGSGRIIMVACREGQLSYIGRGTNSIFTTALMEGLRGVGVHSNNGYISAFNLYEHLYNSVTEVVRDQIQGVQEPELTILKGVGPFAVSLYRGATPLATFDTKESLPEGLPVRSVPPQKSIRFFNQRVIQTGGGAYIGGSISTGGGDFIGRDKIVHGD